MGEFVPKYAPQAEAFSGMITTTNTAIQDCANSIDQICGGIKIGSTEDALATNVIAMTTKVSGELESAVDNNNSVASAVSAAAEAYDEEDYEEFLEEERRIAEELARQQAEAEKKAAAKKATTTTTTTTQIKKPLNRSFEMLEL